MRLIALFCAALALAHPAAAREVSLQLESPVGPGTGELVVAIRGADGAVLDSARQPVAADTVEAVITVPNLSRAAATVQFAALQGGELVQQSPRIAVEGAQPPERATLRGALAQGFSDSYHCTSGAALQLRPAPDARLIVTRAGTARAFTQDGVAGRYTAADGTVLVRAPGLVQLSGPDDATRDSCQPIPAPPLLPLQARGQTAGWVLDATVDGIRLTRAGADPATPAPPPEQAPRPAEIRRLPDGAVRIASGGVALTVRLQACRVPGVMLPYPMRATLSDPATGPDGAAGCAGDPLRALEGAEWTLTHLLGAQLPRGDADDGVPFTLQVTAGRVAGRTGCNRYLGRATARDARLQLRELGTTRLGCPTALANLEHRFLDALEAATGIAIQGDGRMALYAGATAVLQATRAP